MKKIFIYLITVISIINYLIPSELIYSEEHFPQKYNLYDEGIISEAENQYNFNTCWAHSFLSSIESCIQKYGNHALFSKWYMIYSAYTGNFRFKSEYQSSEPNWMFEAGGSPLMATALITGWRGLIDIQKVPYNTSSQKIEQINMENTISGNTKPTYIINNIYGIRPWISSKNTLQNEYIKKLIYEKNSVAITCSMNPDYLNKDTFSLFSSDPSYNYKFDKFYHSVLIIGWDDTYSKNNFNDECRPENDGAWIVRNSWGKEWGYDGNFYISYEDTSLLEPVSCTSVSNNKYDNIYQYDEYGWTISITPEMFKKNANLEMTSGYMANIFQSSQHECIGAVSFYTIEDNAEYEITIYTNLQDIYNPISGQASEVFKGIISQSGYNTIELGENIISKPYEYFSVSVKISNPSSPFTIPAEAYVLMKHSEEIAISNISTINKKIRKGESFISSNGEDWMDIFLSQNGETPYMIYVYNSSLFPSVPEDEKMLEVSFGNVCLKAFSEKMPKFLYDADCNGIVTSADLICTIQMILSGYYFENADIDSNGVLNANDLFLMKNHFLSF